ncbi:MAG: DUF1573 domain-containing protein [Thermoflexibacter sp.]|jgi:hypothetical protein|nr:DUF1573 domain-containing protein [Thermoflexibacter sp.]
MNAFWKNSLYYFFIVCLLGWAVWNFFFSHQPKPLTSVMPTTTQINLRVAGRGTIKDTVIYLQNIGTEDLLLDTIGTDCGCTVAKWHKEPVKSGEKTPITIRFEAKEEGIVLRKVEIHANIDPNPLIINVKATVLPQKE